MLSPAGRCEQCAQVADGPQEGNCWYGGLLLGSENSLYGNPAKGFCKELPNGFTKDCWLFSRAGVGTVKLLIWGWCQAGLVWFIFQPNELRVHRA